MTQGDSYAFCALAHERTPPQVHRTRMIRIERIFTDIFNPCVSVSSVQSVFYPEYNEPQMNADERR